MKTWKDKVEFKQRVLHWAAKMKQPVKSIYIRPMKNKWASCSTNGTLSFNDELLVMDKNLGDYVIVHELVHLRVPNHGKLWKSLMTAYLGNYNEIEQRLNDKGRDKRLRSFLLKV